MRRLLLLVLGVLLLSAVFAKDIWLDPKYSHRRKIEIPLSLNTQFPVPIELKNWGKNCDMILIVDPETKDVFSYKTEKCDKELKLWIDSDKTYAKPLKLYLYYDPYKENVELISDKENQLEKYAGKVASFRKDYSTYYVEWRPRWTFNYSIGTGTSLSLYTRYYGDPILIAYMRLNLPGRRLLQYVVSRNLAHAFGKKSSAFFVRVKDRTTNKYYNVYYFEGASFTDLMRANKTISIFQKNIANNKKYSFEVDPVKDLQKHNIYIKDPEIVGVGRAVKSDGGVAYATLHKLTYSNALPLNADVSNEEGYSIVAKLEGAA